MTVYQCSICGNAHESTGPACVQTIVVSTVPTAREVGRQIRGLLLSLKDTGARGYDLDLLRAQALQHAGFCWSSPGEMAPQCCCAWDPDGDVAGPMREVMRTLHSDEWWHDNTWIHQDPEGDYAKLAAEVSAKTAPPLRPLADETPET